MIIFIGADNKEIVGGHVQEIEEIKTVLRDTKSGYPKWADVAYIQADGHELERIYKIFSHGLPACVNKVVRFTGDYATMIAANW